MDEERILSLLRSHPTRSFPLVEIFKHLAPDAKKEKTIKRLLKNLVQKGQLEKHAGRLYRLSRAGNEVNGRVEFDRRRGALLILDDKKSEPIPILADDHANIEHNDRVRAELLSVGRKGRIFARIMALLERPSARHVGIFRSIAKARYVEVDEVPGYLSRTQRRREVTDVIIGREDTCEAEDGQLVEVELLVARSSKGASPVGRVIQVLGKPGERTAEMRRLFIEHGLPDAFPPDVERGAEAYGPDVSEEDARGRRDVRNIPLVTIDSETAKDFDDAVYAVREDRDHVRVIVAVADVSFYVRPQTALDAEALRRGTSTYLTDRAIPMLPESLSNGLCSLKPHVDRLCMVADIVLDANAHVVSAEFSPAIMRSRARLTYTRVARALEGDPDEECRSVLPSLLMMAQVSHHLLERRLRRGAIDLNLAEPEVRFDGAGKPIDVAKRGRNDAHRLIEELMLLTNETAAKFFLDRRLPSIFRVHEDPDPLKLEVFLGLCAELGFDAKLSKKPKPSEIARMLDDLADHPLGSALHGLLLRSLNQARYDAECKGHYGLASDSYLHFTSPIRRYPDLMVHRMMKALLERSEPAHTHTALSAIAVACSAAERRAMGAERESMDLDRSYVAAEHLEKVFDARITGVQGFGLFASIDAPFVEGLIPVQTLPEDYYELDAYGAMLVGQASGRRYVLGDAIKVEIVTVNIAKRKVEFRLVNAQTDAEPPQTKRRNPGRYHQPGRSRRDTARTHDRPGTGAKHPKTPKPAKPPKPTKGRKVRSKSR